MMIKTVAKTKENKYKNSVTFIRKPMKIRYLLDNFVRLIFCSILKRHRNNNEILQTIDKFVFVEMSIFKQIRKYINLVKLFIIR